MNASNPKQIAFVLYPGLTPLDLIGPLQASRHCPASTPPSRPSSSPRTPTSSRPTPSSGSPRATPSTTRRRHRHRRPRRGATHARRMRQPAADRLRRQRGLRRRDRHVGLHRRADPRLRRAARRPPSHHPLGLRRHPRTTRGEVPPPTWVEDGKYLTTAGVSAGIDGGLYLASRLVGEDAARLIQLGLEYEPEPPFGPIDWDPDIVGRPADLAWPAPRGVSRPPLLAREAAARRDVAEALTEIPARLGPERVGICGRPSKSQRMKRSRRCRTGGPPRSVRRSVND